MKVGIIIYSQTGKTLKAGEKIKTEIQKKGHTAELIRLEPVGPVNQGLKNYQFKAIPNTGSYDFLIFGAPVMAFSLCAVMASYLEQSPDFQGQKSICFVHQFFPFAPMGGNQAVSQLKNIVQNKNSKVLSTFVLNMSSLRYSKRIDDTAAQINNMI